MPIFLQLKRSQLGNKSLPKRFGGNVELACQELKIPAKILVAGKTRLHRKLLSILFGGVSPHAHMPPYRVSFNFVRTRFYVNRSDPASQHGDLLPHGVHPIL